MKYSLMDKADAALQARTEKKVYQAITDGKYGPYPFTRAAVDVYLEDMPQGDKNWAFREILDVMAGFCERNGDKLHSPEMGLIKGRIDYKKKHLEEDGPRVAVNDIFYMEEVYMRGLNKQLSGLEAPDVKGRLIGKMLDNVIRFCDIKTQA